MISVLHITPHLGGGVGKALSGLISESMHLGLEVNHSIATLEALEKDHYASTLIKLDCPVYENISKDEVFKLIGQADIVQIEFWNHPLIPELLISSEFPAARIVLWCHISGMFTPIIPAGLIDCCNKLIFTSDCAKTSREMQSLNLTNAQKIETISSGGGLEKLHYEPKSLERMHLKFGYIGTLSFAKLHPDYVQYLSGVSVENFRVELYGDGDNWPELEQQQNALKAPNLLGFNGYATDIQSVLRELDVLVYLLNPNHYGTAENALIEAMAMGVIPIVLGNPAELEIVKDGVNGLVISSPENLDFIVKKISSDKELRRRLSTAAAESVRKQFSFKLSAMKFDHVYKKVKLNKKKKFNFLKIFGKWPSDWYLAFQKNQSQFKAEGIFWDDCKHTRYLLLEKTKGSITHFHKYFKNDQILNKWFKSLDALKL